MHMKGKKITLSLLIIVAMTFSVLSDVNATEAGATPASNNLNITRYQQVKTGVGQQRPR